MNEEIKECFHVQNTNQIVVSLGMKFEQGEDDFEDVDFIVSNCDDPSKAIDRVSKFVKLLSIEFAEGITHGQPASNEFEAMQDRSKAHACPIRKDEGQETSRT